MAVGDQADDGTGGLVAIALAERDAKLAELTSSNAELTASNAELTAKVEALTKQVEVLTELLNRNSKNSHLLPSSDGPGSGSREARMARNKRRRSAGAATRRAIAVPTASSLLPSDHVDILVDLFPQVCLGCARSLPHVIDAAACRYQQLGLRDHRRHLSRATRQS